MTPNYFSCDVCSSKISVKTAHIHCLDCEDYDMCAACALNERTEGTHLLAHRTRVFKVSGGGGHAPVPSATTIVYSGPDTALDVVPALADLSIHASGYGVGVAALEGTSTASTLSSVGVSAYTTPAAIDQQPIYTLPVAYTPPAPASAPLEPATRWGPFFLEDLTPNPAFRTANERHPDLPRHRPHGLPRPRGLLSLPGRTRPTSGITTAVWKHNLVARRSKSKEDVADAALKHVYDLHSIEYVLRPRSTRTASNSNTMPPLTLKGLMDLTTLEMLSDPSTEWGSISRVINMYDLPAVRGWGTLPRSVLPDVPDPRVTERVARVLAAEAAEHDRRLEASRAKLMLQAQGEQNALDLLDDRRYTYRYY
ncbi:hypothetical protein B0H13DRAFT_2518157 [Mycena leptocephala]|nr:hypothetical protein B0H13DRAFT_2518157 [Mycena leptocephala]